MQLFSSGAPRVPTLSVRRTPQPGHPSARTQLWGNQVTVRSGSGLAANDFQQAANDPVPMHSTGLPACRETDVPVITRGEGPYVYDTDGTRELDGLAGLFLSQVGPGRTEIAEAIAEQSRKLAYF